MNNCLILNIASAIACFRREAGCVYESVGEYMTC